MSEQTSFYIQTQNADPTDSEYLDCAAALSATNRKQYHQFKRDGTPLAYHLRITQTGGGTGADTIIETAANNWTVRNACKQFAIGWKKQLEHAGIKLSDLSPYGRRPRVALEEEGLNQATVHGKTIIQLANFLEPYRNDQYGTALWFPGYNDAAGNAVAYEDANMLTDVAVDDAAGTPTFGESVMICGAAATEFRIVKQYNISRRNIPTTDTEDIAAPTSKMMTLFSTAETMSDDIVESIDDYGDWQPYDGSNHSESVVQVATLAPPVDSADNYPPSTDTIIAPLGLVKFTPTVKNTTYFVEVLAVHEM